MNIRKIIKEEVKKVMELMMRREDEIPLPGNEENRNNFRKNSPMYKKAEKLKTEREVETTEADEVEVMEENEKLNEIGIIEIAGGFVIGLLALKFLKYAVKTILGTVAVRIPLSVDKLKMVNKELFEKYIDKKLKSGKLGGGDILNVAKIRNEVDSQIDSGEIKNISDVIRYFKSLVDTAKQTDTEVLTEFIKNKLNEAKTTDTAMKPNKKTEDDKAIEKIRKERTDNEKKPRWPSDITDENLDRITKKLNIDWHKFSKTQFKKGIKVEHEHDDITHGDLLLTAKIVWAHLKENPKYYDALENMEKKLDDKIQTKTKSEAPMKIKENVDVERWQKLAGLKK